MSCTDSKTLGPIPVWSNKTNNTWLFHPLSAPQPSTGVNFARPTLEVAQSSGAIKVRPVVRYSNDMQTWDGPFAIDAANMTQTNDGVKFGTFTDIQGGAKNFLQWGVEVTDSAGTPTELAMVSLRVDTKA